MTLRQPTERHGGNAGIDEEVTVMVPESSVPEIPRLKTCGLYVPGHAVHWIQSKRAFADQDNPPEEGRLIEVNGGSICHQPGWGLLLSPGRDGSTWDFCVVDADADDIRECREEVPAGDLVDRLLRTGGFTVRAADVEKLVGRDSEDDW
jgi:hypothetical protein